MAETSGAFATEAFTLTDKISSLRLLGQLMVHATYGKGWGEAQHNVLVTGLPVAWMGSGGPAATAAAHALFWGTPFEDRAGTIARLPPAVNYVSARLSYFDPNNPTVSELIVHGRCREVDAKELPGFLAVYNDQCRVDRMDEVDLEHFSPEAQQNPDNHTKRLYVVGLSSAALAAPVADCDGARRAAGPVDIPLEELTIAFTRRPTDPDVQNIYPNLRFKR